MDVSQWKVLTKRGPLEEGWQTTPVFLPLEPHEQYEKAKRHDTRRRALQVGKYPVCCWGRVRTCLLCAKRYIWSLSWRYCHLSPVLLNQKGQQIVGGGGSCSYQLRPKVHQQTLCAESPGNFPSLCSRKQCLRRLDYWNIKELT